ncbi:unnamed protein product [Closterium sp. Yama58-4]|nr:unnamed protein product [Closterium sp. Yama58-4]
MHACTPSPAMASAAMASAAMASAAMASPAMASAAMASPAMASAAMASAAGLPCQQVAHGAAAERGCAVPCLVHRTPQPRTA